MVKIRKKEEQMKAKKVKSVVKTVSGTGSFCSVTSHTAAFSEGRLPLPCTSSKLKYVK